MTVPCDVPILIGRYVAVAEASRAEIFACSTCNRVARNLEATQ